MKKKLKIFHIQSSRQNYKNFIFNRKKDYQILKETKLLHQKRKDLSKIQIIELSILFVILNFANLIIKKTKELYELKFLIEKNESLKNIIIASLNERVKINDLKKNLEKEYEQILKEIEENSNIQVIVKNKTDKDILDLLKELIQDHKDQRNLKKIESLEQELINNLDENSYSELIKLKNQLNRD